MLCASNTLFQLRNNTLKRVKNISSLLRVMPSASGDLALMASTKKVLTVVDLNIRASIMAASTVVATTMMVFDCGGLAQRQKGLVQKRVCLA
ncbi:hypothetical protein Syun_009796 [Stephania yunnanensis]|uniref:Uncharacterized protein n=1 Tax=Stephania yunnanensis TaxID=152371 RepID=A0AAP0KHN7_9MAGN